jgi:hypothetical protein
MGRTVYIRKITARPSPAIHGQLTNYLILDEIEIY